MFQQTTNMDAKKQSNPQEHLPELAQAHETLKDSEAAERLTLNKLAPARVSDFARTVPGRC